MVTRIVIAAITDTPARRGGRAACRRCDSPELEAYPVSVASTNCAMRCSMHAVGPVFADSGLCATVSSSISTSRGGAAPRPADEPLVEIHAGAGGDRRNSSVAGQSNLMVKMAKKSTRWSCFNVGGPDTANRGRCLVLKPAPRGPDRRVVFISAGGGLNRNILRDYVNPRSRRNRLRTFPSRI